MGTAELKSGTHVGGKYRVQELLATGGMGFVYAARHEATGRSVAIKLLRPELAGRPDVVRRVSREARLAVDASHPNVVEVLDAGADEAGVPYLVLERLYGQPLEALLGEPLSLRATCEALVPILNALVTLHRAGIVHRDLKPSNIFLSVDEQGRLTPKLLDFGIAKAVEGTGATLTGTTLGTPAYMAPEQLLGSSNASPASDIWSIAVVCVRCLTGRLPFADLATRGLGSLRSGLTASELEGIPAPVAGVLAAALALEPRERPASASELRRVLLAALEQLASGFEWPHERSISFGAAESELVRVMRARGSSMHASGDAERAALGRPKHLLTRTLARVFESTALRPAQWRASLGLAFVVGASIAASWGEPGSIERKAASPSAELPTRVSAALQVAPEDASAQPATDRARTSHPPAGGSTPPTPPASSAAAFETARLEATPAPPERSAPETSPAVRRRAAGPRGVSDSSAERPPAVTQTLPAEPEQESGPVLGANRSPIIE